MTQKRTTIDEVLKSIESKCLGETAVKIETVKHEDRTISVILRCPKCNEPLTPKFAGLNFTYLLECRNCNDKLAYGQRLFKYYKKGTEIVCKFVE